MARLGPLALLCVACVTRVPVEDREVRSTCLDAHERSTRPRVEAGRMVLEDVWGPSVCTGKPSDTPPRRVAEIDLSAASPTCPVGALVARAWSGGSSVERTDFAATLNPRHVGALTGALSLFSPRDIATAYLVECKANGEADWLFISGERVGFWSPSEPTARATPGHPRVLFPQPPPPPAVSSTPEPGTSEREQPDQPEPAPPNVTREGCPAPPLAATWSGRMLSWSDVLPGPNSLERHALRVEGKRATLVFERQQSNRRDPAPGWRCESSTTLEGDVSAVGSKTVFTFGGAVLRCQPRALSVAPKTAVRLPLPPIAEDCARHKWSIARSVKVKALVCDWDEAGRPTFFTSEKLVFGVRAAPLERVVVDGDTSEDFAPAFEAMRVATDSDPAPPTPGANRPPWPGTR